MVSKDWIAYVWLIGNSMMAGCVASPSHALTPTPSTAGIVVAGDAPPAECATLVVERTASANHEDDCERDEGQRRVVYKMGCEIRAQSDNLVTKARIMFLGPIPESVDRVVNKLLRAARAEDPQLEAGRETQVTMYLTQSYDAESANGLVAVKPVEYRFDRPIPNELTDAMVRELTKTAVPVVGWPGRVLVVADGPDRLGYEQVAMRLVALSQLGLHDSGAPLKGALRFQARRPERWGDASVFETTVASAENNGSEQAAGVLEANGELLARGSDGAFVALHMHGTACETGWDCSRSKGSNHRDAGSCTRTSFRLDISWERCSLHRPK